MKKLKNKKLIMAIMFALFVVASFCMPKVENVSAHSTCDGGTEVHYYFLFNEALGNGATINSPTRRGKHFNIKYESDFDFVDGYVMDDSGKIEVNRGTTSGSTWNVGDYWDYNQYLSHDNGYYFRPANSNTIYASAVNWENSDNNGDVMDGGVIMPGSYNNIKSDLINASVISDNITTNINMSNFNPIRQNFVQSQNSNEKALDATFVITRNYNNITVPSSCPVNVKIDTSGSQNPIEPESAAKYCYHLAVYHVHYCGLDTLIPTESTAPESTAPTPHESTNPTKTIYTLIYDLNYGEEKGKDWHTQTSENNNTFDIYSKRPTREGYVFSGWADTEDGEARYQPDAKNAVVTFPDKVYEKRIYAVWIPEGTDYTVTYDANGGQGAPDSQTAPAGTCVVISKEKPTLEGNTFLGWNPNKYAPEASSTYAPGTEYCGGDITLYAVWQPNTGIKDYAMVAGILALAAGAGLLIVKRTNIFKQI